MTAAGPFNVERLPFRSLLLASTLSLAWTDTYAQTNVSGGLFANTTWDLAGSPYILSGTVSLFPGFTLTIEPGVAVLFNPDAMLEIRQSALHAVGTAAEPILFSSNTATTPGSWNQIYLNGGSMRDDFDHCVFNYAQTGIFDNRGGAGDSLVIRHSRFEFNLVGLNGLGTGVGIIDSTAFVHNTSNGILSNFGGTFTHCDFSNNGTGIDCNGSNHFTDCLISHNENGITSIRNSELHHCAITHNGTGVTMIHQGILLQDCAVDSNTIGVNLGYHFEGIWHCQFRGNTIGITDHNPDGFWTNTIKACTIEDNTVGLELSIANDSIYCNRLCGNTAYDLKYLGVNNVSLPHNYWCTTDSATIEAHIYDAYDDASFGIVTFTPVDETECASITGIAPAAARSTALSIRPNPSDGRFTIQNAANGTVSIFDLRGMLMFQQVVRSTTSVDASTLPDGVYMITFNAANKLPASARLIIVR